MRNMIRLSHSQRRTEDFQPAALVELAWRLVRFQPNYRPVVKWRRVLQKGALATGAARKKAIVAVARQLAVNLWRLRTGRLNPGQLGLKD
jgi:transposase